MEFDPQHDEEMADISFREALSILRENAGDYLAARRELLQIEAKEASYVLAKKITLAIITLVVALFTYFLFWGLVIFIGGALLEGKINVGGLISESFIVAVAVGFIHLIGLLVLVNKLKKKPEFELFEVTKAELTRDKEWLERNK